MNLEDTTGERCSLREHLRAATAAMHDRLDAAVTMLDITAADDYRRFLSLQLMARDPIEAWLSAQDTAFGPPPALTGLIRDDLDELGGPVVAGVATFAPSSDADAIGAYWAIAGSSMGNRTMHVRLVRVASGLPARFLGDAATVRYWQALKPRLDAVSTAAEAAPAVSCALAVFATFLSAAEQCLPYGRHGEAA